MIPGKLKQQIDNFINFEPVLNTIEEDVAIIGQDFRVIFENCQSAFKIDPLTASNIDPPLLKKYSS